MKTIYECEHCGDRFSEEIHALACEDKHSKKRIVLGLDIDAIKIGLGLRISTGNLVINFSQEERDKLRTFLNEG